MMGDICMPAPSAPVRTAEAVISHARGSLVGVCRSLGRTHLQRYPDQIV
jgi:hypothetical protein